jgi:archaemetzincin
MIMLIIINPPHFIDINRYLIEPLAKTFNEIIKIDYNAELLRESWDEKRQQYKADMILDAMPLPQPGNRNLAIMDSDVYALGLNYIFGEAEANSKKALISLYRLHPEFYGLISNEVLYKERILKEAVHELGHTYGLMHCPNRHCVMHFSNSIWDTDIKEWKFCPLCLKTIAKKL